MIVADLVEALGVEGGLEGAREVVLAVGTERLDVDVEVDLVVLAVDCEKDKGDDNERLHIFLLLREGIFSEFTYYYIFLLKNQMMK